LNGRITHRKFELKFIEGQESQKPDQLALSKVSKGSSNLFEKADECADQDMSSEDRDSFAESPSNGSQISPGNRSSDIQPTLIVDHILEDYWPDDSASTEETFYEDVDLMIAFMEKYRKLP